MSETENLLNLVPAEAERRLREFAVEIGESAYRGSQVLRHLWTSPVASFEEMTDLPKALRARLAERFAIPRLAIAAQSP